MRYLFNPALVLFTILVCSSASATDPAQLADSIRQQAQGKATDQRPTPIQQAFGQYGHDPASTPLEIQKAATEFLKAGTIDSHSLSRQTASMA